MALIPTSTRRAHPKRSGSYSTSCLTCTCSKWSVKLPRCSAPGLLLAGRSWPHSNSTHYCAILQVAGTVGCEYERLQHGAIAAGVGATSEQVTLLATASEDRDQDAMNRAFTPGQRAVISFTDQVAGPGRASEAEVAALREYLADRCIVELLLVIGHYFGIALLAETVRLDLDEPAQMAVVDLAAGATSDGQ